MKKLALLLGSLLLVGATAQAKEAIAAPVEVSKEVVVVAEPIVEEVMVVEEPVFKPTGSLGMTLRYYGETEGCTDDVGYTLAGPATDFWNRGANNRSRLETTFGIQLTEKSKLAIRVRDFKSWELDNGDDVASENGTETRVQYYYSHNDKFTSRLQYRSEENDSQNFEYKLIYNLYSNQGGLLSNVTLEPSVYHGQAANNGDNYINVVGLDVGYAGNLPLGFTYDGMVYFDQYFYNVDRYKGTSLNDDYDKALNITWEFYLYRSFALYANEKTNVDFNFAGGYDPYVFNQYDSYSKDAKTDVITFSNEKNTYSAYMDLGVSTKYQLTPAVALNGGIGAEYRNWDNIDESSASTWRWQPYAYVGMKATF